MLTTNRADIKEIPEETREELTFHFIHDVREAIDRVLLPAEKSKSEKKRRGKASQNGHATIEKGALDISTPAEQDTERTEAS